MGRVEEKVGAVTWDVPGDTWEERMAARTARRRIVAEAERIAQQAEADRQLQATLEARLAQQGRYGWDWLNGWPRMGDTTVLMGSGVHCIGCGRLYGVTCVVFLDGWTPPGPEPDWPFTSQDCPICGSVP